MKVKEREEARRLRREDGLAISKIARRLGVAKGSVSLWVRDIELTPKQIQDLNDRKKNGGYIACIRGGKTNRLNAERRRERYQTEGYERAKKDGLFRLICALYWGEGHKARNKFSLANCDTEMLALIGRWLVLEGYEDKISFFIQCHEGDGPGDEDVKKRWKEKLSFLRDRHFRKITRIKINRASQRKRIGRQPYGTGTVIVCNTELVQKVMGGIEYLKQLQV